MEHDYGMNDVEDDLEEEFLGIGMGHSESDDDEYVHINGRITDTSSAQARKGKDLQGIPWDRLSITRAKYRKTRLEQYKNYENVTNSGESSAKGCKPTEKGKMYYEFWRNTRSAKSTILHFQLRNLVWATSKHDVYLMSNYSVFHWSALTRQKSEVLDVSGHIAPSEKHPGNLQEGFSQTQVSTMAVKDKILVAGGFQGELIFKVTLFVWFSYACFITMFWRHVGQTSLLWCCYFYHMEFISGAVHFMASNNDSGVRDYDMEKFQLSRQFSFPWPVNHSSLSPDGKLLVVVGDNPDGIIADSHSGKTIHDLQGHLDYSFASAWNPDGRIFATGNQDKTCRVWDVRNMSKSIAILRANLGAIRSIRFTSDGQFMAMAEPADFVHIFDVRSGGGYEKQQELDFFGEISGMSFSPDTEALFVGVWDRTYGSLLQYKRCRNLSYLDSMI
ncbi:uncharacterized WD repeat-containing protein C2A9.03-like [Phalaenopsis equestris]|uniref:uncharacterized WD repeat-containing protein C2A9.03-like n=1 Tax=Phalaenopsis equestris TaxID=78828 RepID=UPI0009E430BD|nr:uncharacterized WD repeat-containing protein C2A9.03-like [Phalaenopsis equestris]